ncbi:MAG: ribonuclease P protein component [Ignavibacteria bacterium]
MDNRENQQHDDLRLRKCEIVRGHNSYLKILKNSVLVSANLLKAFVSQERNPSDLASEIRTFRESPLFTNNVKVGFVVAKKKVGKAVLRNRIRRLLRESYRLNKNLFTAADAKINIIFSLTENGYKQFEIYPDIGFKIIDDEMKILASKIINQLKVK